MAISHNYYFEVLIAPPVGGQELEPEALSYELTYHDPTFDNACFYVPVLPADAFIREVPYFNTFPTDGILHEDICRGGSFDVIIHLSYTVTPHRVIDPFTLPDPATFWKLTYDVPILVWNILPYSLTITPEVPIVFRNVWSSVEQSCGLILESFNSTHYDIFYRVANYFDSTYKIRVFSSITQFVPFTSPVSPSVIITPYELNLYTELSSHNAQNYTLFVESIINQNYGINSVILSSNQQPYELSLYTELSSYNIQDYVVFVESATIQNYGINALVLSSTEQLYNLSEAVASRIDQLYSVLSYTPVTASVMQVWTLVIENSVIPIVTEFAYITVDSKRIEVNDINIDLDEDSFAWSLSATIQDSSSFNKLPINKEFILTALGTDFIFIVDAREVTRGSLDNRIIEVLTLSALSPTVLLDFPRAEPYTRTWEVDASAKTIVTEILADNSFPKDLFWEIQDWSIPRNRVSITEGSPITLIQNIAEAAGAVATTNKNGDLVVKAKFPVCPVDWNSSTADHVLTDSENIFEFKEEFEVLKFYDSVRVRDIVPTYNDALEWEADEDPSGRVTSGYLYLYLSPPRDSVTLKTSSGASIGLPVEELKELEEDSEFLGKQSTLTKPIHSIETVVWYEHNLGSVLFEQYSTNLTSTNTELENSVARISYTAKVLKYRITYSKPIPSSETVPAQFYIEDSAL